MSPQAERDFPIGHPAAFDTVIGSDEHLAWLEQHKFLENARDFPPGHPKAIDTAGNLNHLTWPAGVDPLNPHREPFTGRLPEQAAAVKEWQAAEAAGAHESPVVPVIDQAVANAALAAERERLGVDSLTMEQHQAVLATLQHLALQPPTPAQIRLTAEQVEAGLKAGNLPPEWAPTTGKPWWGTE